MLNIKSEQKINFQQMYKKFFYPQMHEGHNMRFFNPISQMSIDFFPLYLEKVFYVPSIHTLLLSDLSIRHIFLYVPLL